MSAGWQPLLLRGTWRPVADTAIRSRNKDSYRTFILEERALFEGGESDERSDEAMLKRYRTGGA